MPNWVKNILSLEASAERINELAEFVKGTDENGEVNVFSLNKIVPMPDELNMRKSAELFGKDGYKEAREQEEKDNQQKYGYASWYFWRLAKWGTKWDTDEAVKWDSFKDVYEFNTAWSAPKKALIELSRRFPDITFRLEYADEDYGYNCGIVIYKDGAYTVPSEVEQGSKEATEFAFEVWDCADYYVWNDEKGKYELYNRIDN